MAGQKMGSYYFLAFYFLTLAVERGAVPQLGIDTISLESSEHCSGQLVAMKFQSMYNGTRLQLTLSCDKGKTFTLSSLEWIMTSMDCLNEVTSIIEEQHAGCPDFDNLKEASGKNILPYKATNSELLTFHCSNESTFTLPLHNMGWQHITTTTVAATTITTPSSVQKATSSKSTEDEGNSEEEKDKIDKTEKTTARKEKRRSLVKREDSKQDSKLFTAAYASTLSASATTAASAVGVADVKTSAVLTAAPIKDKSTLLTVPADGIYLFVLSLKIDDLKNITGTISYPSSYGYLSALDWPLLPFYSVMLAVYLVYMLAWLILCCYYRQDILRIQYWIGGVILLGLLEKTIYVGEYHTLNRTGVSSVYGALMFGEVVSCAKRTLSRMLVIIASVGFGIVRPRLGPTLHKIMIVGAVYFILAIFEGYFRITATRAELTNVYKAAFISISVIDIGICFWIFSGLVETMRTLRIRRNLVKLSLYRHFTNTLIFSVLASFAYMIWSMKQHKFVTCLKDWKEIWVDDAFWHLLFSILLLIIMILWRPSANNQRYAYSPLLDAEDQEQEEPMLNDAFEGIKLRQKSQENGSTLSSRHKDHQTEDDLRWIEENIPTSLADSALPSLLDSEEELAATNYEISKMH